MIKRLLFSVILMTLTVSSNASLITGNLNSIKESAGTPFSWGDGVNDLFQEWSVSSANFSGWFYTSEIYGSSNADVFVYSDLSDLASIDDASQFNYQSTGAVFATEGDTVFFRGQNGYYGAWYISDIFADNDFYSALSGTWYFQDDGSADFSTKAVAIPTPSVLLILLTALAFFFRKSFS